MAASTGGKRKIVCKSVVAGLAIAMLSATASSAAPLLYGYVKEDTALQPGTRAAVTEQIQPATAPAQQYRHPGVANQTHYSKPAQPAPANYTAAQPQYAPAQSAYAVPERTLLQSAVALAPQQQLQIQNDPLSRFQGTWQSVTVVTDSLVATVPAGQQVVSTMEFAKSNEGRLHARWQQPGWREAQAAITVLSPENFLIDRTSYYMDGSSWATRSRDQYTLLGNSQILAVSEIDQYIDGRYVGRYCTRSVLTKISDSTSVAFR